MFFLFALATAEEKSKFEFIYTQYKNLMLQKAHAILRDTMLAEDAVSEAYIRIYKNLHKIDNPASGRCIAFITTIVRNTALTLLNKQNKQPVSFLSQDTIEEFDRDTNFDLEQYVCSEISSEEIFKAINLLGEDLKSVFLLKFSYDLSHKKIGELLNISENNVTVRLHRAKKKLTGILVKEGYADEKRG
jgi:RNA polymerase sigma-70 factor (ECF subfamily)